MELFILNGVDYTNKITVPSYKVQSEPVTKTWEDATYTNHIDVLRYRIKGSFTMYFDDNEELTSFLTELANSTAIDNYVSATLYDNRLNMQKESRYTFKIELINNRPYFGRKQHDGYNVTIEEQ